MLKTDAQIQSEVQDELRLAPMVNATHIGVEVRQGVVTLTGHVDSYGEKWHAEQAAQHVGSVKALAVEMQVMFPGSPSVNDSEIAHAVKNVLDWNVFIPSNAVKVMVESGWVTLSGKVSADYQRRIAESSIRYLTGVRGVSNQLALKPAITGSVLKADIEATLQRRASKEAQGIGINIHDHEVTLTGRVNSLAERDVVLRAVWDSPGVWLVRNHMEVHA
jgi:osmotically-inducible protein OsmY